MQETVSKNSKRKKAVRQHCAAPAYTGPNMARLHISYYEAYAKKYNRNRKSKKKNSLQKDLVSESNEQV
jgi:hypothetical protein